MKKAAIIGIMTITGLLMMNLVSAQCPMCKTALKSNRDSKTPVVGKGINKGILFLLTAPYLLVGTAGFVYYRNSKKKKADA